MQQKHKKAFTLIELMVAMGIIAVLITMSILGISLVQQSLRNTQRRDALNSVNLAVNTYFSNNGTFPTSITIAANQITVGPEIIPLVGPQRASIPAVAATSQNSPYCFSSNGGAYALGIGLEGGGELQLGNSGTPCAVP